MEMFKKFNSNKNFILARIIEIFSIDPKKDLGKPLFEVVSGMVPNVNVDLLCYDSSNRFALVYRHDRFYGPGWHIPGGVLRFKERLENRLTLTAKRELQINSITEISKINISEIFAKDRDVRGHFISFLFRAKSKELDKNGNFNPRTNYENGSIAMFSKPPNNLIEQHKRFAHIMGRGFKKGVKPDSFITSNL